MFWFVSALIGQFRIELKRAELVHGFFNLSKVVLPLMDSKNHAPALLHSSLTWIYQSEQRQIKTFFKNSEKSWKKWIRRLVILLLLRLDDSGTRRRLRLCTQRITNWILLIFCSFWLQIQQKQPQNLNIFPKLMPIFKRNQGIPG